jgi:DEAD/DEAH box helicase domain-containing protein
MPRCSRACWRRERSHCAGGVAPPVAPCPIHAARVVRRGMTSSSATAASSPFHLVASHVLPGREAQLRNADDLEVGRAGRRYLDALGRDSLWSHQYEAVAALIRGDDVCVATGTASGKTLVFHLAALRALDADPTARVLALYPTKALAEEQEARWRKALRDADLPGDVARIDGDVPTTARVAICKSARVLIATPDVVHSWMLPRAGAPKYEPVGAFLRNLRVVVLDEVHAYSGIFGSNAAFLFRRLEHVVGVLGGRYGLVAASATIANPGVHLHALTGRNVSILEEDGSPRHPLTLEFVRPSGSNVHDALTAIFDSLQLEQRRFLAFFDSRKQAEHAGAVMLRERGNTDDTDDTDGGGTFDRLLCADVLPYRAGYEPEHRRTIQRRLTEGTLAGVLSTSALELGLDIPGLDVVVLAGTPASATSLHQRMGRVGRHAPGTVIVLDMGTASDELAFANPESLLARPLVASTIFLESRRIQYIHAMCLARPDGEHDLAARFAGQRAPFAPDPAWPAGFADLCAGERTGTVPSDVRDLRRETAPGELPNLTFPLRDVERQFAIWLRQGRDRVRMGSIGFAQLMREAYPNAVYYYGGRAHRVVKVDRHTRTIEVERCPSYTTQPSPAAEQIAPQRETYQAARAGELVAIECDLKIRQAILGVRERRGSLVEAKRYPIDGVWSTPSFAREFFTTGVVLAHPVLDGDGVDLEVLAALVSEAFRLVVPVERQDVDGGLDTLRAAWAGLAEGRRFLALHDQTYGSLRISGRLLDEGVLERVFPLVVALADRANVALGAELRDVTDATRKAARALAEAIAMGRHACRIAIDEDAPASAVPVMLPTSKAASADRPGMIFEIQRVFSHCDRGLVYRGVWVDDAGRREPPSLVTVASVEPVEGQARWGFYEPDLDELRAA